VIGLKQKNTFRFQKSKFIAKKTLLQPFDLKIARTKIFMKVWTKFKNYFYENTKMNCYENENVRFCLNCEVEVASLGRGAVFLAGWPQGNAPQFKGFSLKC
jgi:hypothetical protein